MDTIDMPGWAREGDTLVREFSTDPAGADITEAAVVEAAGIGPDAVVSWDDGHLRVVLGVITGNLTDRHLAAARRVEQMLTVTGIPESSP